MNLNLIAAFGRMLVALAVVIVYNGNPLQTFGLTLLVVAGLQLATYEAP